LEEGVFTITPQLDVSLKNEGKSVERFEARLSAIVNISCVPQITVSGSYDKAIEKNLWRKGHWYWTSIGAIPVGVKLTTSITAKADINLDSSAEFSGGFRKHGKLWVKGVYVRGDSPEEGFKRGYDPIPVEEVPLVFAFNGGCSVLLSLVPQIDCRLYGCAGVYLNADPRLEISGTATAINGALQHANIQVWARANVNAGLSVIGFANDELPSLPFLFFEQQLTGGSVVINDPLQICAQSRSQSIKSGDSISLFVEAAGGTGDYSYQWFHNGQHLPGEAGSRLYLNRVTSGLSGSYIAEIISGPDRISSEEINLSVVQDNFTGAVFGMVPIEGGTNSGEDPDFGYYSLTVDSFFMDATEVAGRQWNAVRMKALAFGYNIFFGGGGVSSSLPVRGVTWRECLVWCNARSQMEGRMPCYWVGGMPYRGETNVIPECNFFANGYRLPTVEEWEYAARGGLHGKRFPWGDAISHDKANYFSSATLSFDVSSTRGYHPFYTSASPVGSFKSNGYGLYDMSGNVAEWCWDEASLGTGMQLAKGGARIMPATWTRCGDVFHPWPDNIRNGFIGFRTVCR
jgi:hypothetical protein